MSGAGLVGGWAPILPVVVGTDYASGERALPAMPAPSRPTPRRRDPGDGLPDDFQAAF